MEEEMKNVLIAILDFKKKCKEENKSEDEMISMIELLTDGAETPSQFAKSSTKERIRRMSARDKRAKEQSREKQIAELTPLVIEIIKSAKANHLLE